MKRTFLRQARAKPSHVRRPSRRYPCEIGRQRTLFPRRWTVWQRRSHTTWDPTTHDNGHELRTWQTVLAIRHVAVFALCVIAVAVARDPKLTAFAVLACVPY